MKNEIKANKVKNYSEATNPGDYFFAEYQNDIQAVNLSFLCPCGCGRLSGVKLRKDLQHTNNSWAWNGNKDCLTVTPSILIDRGHWHGYLTDGVFVEC